MKILFLGDAHAAWHRLYDGVQRAHRDHGVQAAIQVGDFGFFRRFAGAPLGASDGFVMPVPLHVIDGNHEDHAWLRSQIESGAVDVWERQQRIVFQPRGSVREIGGLVIGFCGGALHVDQPQVGSSEHGTTNWVTDQEADKAAAMFAMHRSDLIVTHSCPHSIGVGMQGNPYLEEEVERHVTRRGFSAGPLSDCGEPGLLELWKRLRYRPREWVFGHFHQHRVSQVDGVRFRCIGAIDGSDHRAEPVMYVLDTTMWAWTTMTI